MISIKELRKNKSAYKNSLMKRGEKFNLENIIQMDSQIRAMKTSANDMRELGGMLLLSQLERRKN